MSVFVIDVHSFVDVITNSSTTVYVRAGEGSIKAIKKFIDGILEKGGSKKKADDLFEFKIGMGESEMESAMENYWEGIEEQNEEEKDESKKVKIPSWENGANMKTFKKLIAEGKINMKEIEADTDDDEYPKSNALIMTTKDDSKDSEDIISLFESMFEIDGYRNG